MSQSLSLKPLSKTALDVPFSGIRRFFDIAASMQDVVSLGVGEPDFVTPWSVREAAIYSLERGQTTYTSNYGLLELRREIARYLNKRYKVDYSPEAEILVTVGVSEGLDLAMRVLLNPGDEVLIPEPCYVSYRPCVSLAGGVPVGVETRSDAKFAVTAEQLKAACTERTKAILLGYPSNPTGAVLSREQIIEIINFARERGLYVVSDEIYDRLTYEGIHTCVASVPGAREITVLLNGFSKAHAMTGWRIAYACAPEHILKMMMKIHSYTMLCAPITGQIAAVEALKHAEKEVEEMVSHYRQRRRLIVDGLNRLGLTCHMPLGAFYAFPSIESTGLTAEQFAERLLLEERVAVVPGTAFGAGGDGHIRCSYATSVEKLELALSRMRTFVEKLR
ncbi:MAG TPA: aminotransferase class I/II-fold pyridoxal phosphate-dependent enzyme [Candidatus Melainabacteria bacterium]|jgi:aminotransferase|nr:aminotransferase class I/II-fold pyridoxal phosphate-dependent enzyme [Candidatus Melainabacteria bacterium]